MDHLPLSDIPMLVSTISFLLRDEIFDNLDQRCYSVSEKIGHLKMKAPDGKMRSGWIGGKSGFRAGPKKVIAILSRVLLKAFLPCSWRRTLREDAGGAI